MTEMDEFDRDPGDWIHGVAQRVESLAAAGEIYDMGMARAFYRSSDETVEYLEVRSWPQKDSHIQAGLLMMFKDGSTFYMTWSEGSIWSLDHSVATETDGRDTGRVLPYSNDKLRHDYVSKRENDPATEAKGYLNFRNILAEGYHGEPFIPIEEIDGFMSRVLEDVNKFSGDPAFELLGIMSKDIDPADLDLHQMFQQVQDIDPASDLLAPELLLSEVVDPTDYDYMFREERRIAKALLKLERQGRSDKSYDVALNETTYLTRMSPHVGKHLHIRATNIRQLDSSGESELVKADNVNGMLRSLTVTGFMNDATGESELGMVLLLELARPYPEDVLTHGEEHNPFPNPVVFIALSSITEMRKYRSFLEDAQ